MYSQDKNEMIEKAKQLATEHGHKYLVRKLRRGYWEVVSRPELPYMNHEQSADVWVETNSGSFEQVQ